MAKNRDLEDYERKRLEKGKSGKKTILEIDLEFYKYKLQHILR